MHENITRIQEKVADHVGEYMKILEISDNRPVVMSVLALAEKPLTEEEISARCRLQAKDVRKALHSLTSSRLTVQISDSHSAATAYELNPDLPAAVAGNARAKADAIRIKMKAHIAEYEDLLEADKTNFDAYDRLMAKYLREKISKLKLFEKVMAKRSSFLRFLETGIDENTAISKVTIE